MFKNKRIIRSYIGMFNNLESYNSYQVQNKQNTPSVDLILSQKFRHLGKVWIKQTKSN